MSGIQSRLSIVNQNQGRPRKRVGGSNDYGSNGSGGGGRVDDDPQQPYRRKTRSENSRDLPQELVTIKMANSKNIDYITFKSWLERKAKKELKIYSHQWGRGQLDLYVRPEDVSSLQRLDGFQYGDQQLEIVVSQSVLMNKAEVIPAALATPEVQNLIREFLKTRFDQTRNLLILSSLSQVPPLMEGLQKMTSGAWNAIFQMISQCCPNVATISFDGNHLKTLYALSGLPFYLPNVENLSFGDNQINDMKSVVAVLSPLNRLREVNLVGNPLADIPNYRNQMAKAFPNLQFLDTTPFERSVSSSNVKFGDIPQEISVKLPIEPSGSFFDSQETHATTAGFLVKYMHFFDTNRSMLIDAYSQTNSYFSLTVNAQTPACRKVRQHWECPDVEFSLSRPRHSPSWVDVDRNLLKQRRQKQPQFLFSTPLDIVHRLTRLPETQHKHPQSYLIDSWQVQNVGAVPQMFINVHGVFTEVQSKQDRYFDRLFVLIPSMPGSKAQLSGWPVEIINDMLTVRSKPNQEALKRVQQNHPSQTVEQTVNLEQYAILPAVVGKGAVASTATNNSDLNQQQQHIAMELSRETGLNLPFSIICLSEQNWDKSLALQAFHAAKMANRIPPEAFK